MIKIIKNKKGFTLVELLAVIVILALIMGIAVISMGGVMESARKSTLRRTAGSIIDGVRQQLTLANELEVGDYYFQGKILEKGGVESPLGGNFLYITDTKLEQISDSIEEIGRMGIYRTSAGALCDNSNTAYSFVNVSKDDNGNYVYRICLTAGVNNYRIDLATEEQLLDDNDNEIFTKTNNVE